MFYLVTTLYVIGYLLTLPIKFILQLIMRLLWFPRFKFDPTVLGNGFDYGKRAAAQAAIAEHLGELALDDDFAKSAGIYHACMGDEASYALLKQHIMSMCFIRRRRDRMTANTPNFSGDMLAGMLYGLWHANKNGLVRPSDRATLKSIATAAIYGKPYWTLKHPYDGDYDRGILFRPWHLGQDAPVLSAFLLVMGTVTRDVSLLRMYRAFKLLTWPLILYPELAVALGPVQQLSWFDEHSKMMLACTGYQLDKSLYWKWQAKFLYRRYGKLNPDIAGMYFRYIEPDDAALKTAQAFITDYKPGYKDGLNSTIGDDELVSYVYPLDLTTKKYAPCVLPASKRTGKYLWEENALKPRTAANSGCVIDLLHLLYLTGE